MKGYEFNLLAKLTGVHYSCKLFKTSTGTFDILPGRISSGKLTSSEISSQFSRSCERTAPNSFSIYLSKKTRYSSPNLTEVGPSAPFCHPNHNNRLLNFREWGDTILATIVQ